jgi:GT2 family glycosyltransferase
VRSNESKPVVSVVSSVEREWAELADRFIGALENQQNVDVDRLEVIVVDGFGDDGLADRLAVRLKSYDGPLQLELLSTKKCGRAAAHNRGIERSKSDLILLLADDFIATPALVSAHLQLHQERPGEHVVGIGPGIFPPEWELSPYMHWLDHGGGLFGISFIGENARPPPPGFFYGANTSIKRSLLEQAGPFDEDFPYDCADDSEMGVRLRKLGMRSVYLPEAIAHHWHEQDLEDGRIRGRLGGESAAILDLKVGGMARLRAGLERNRKIRFRRPKNMRAFWKTTIHYEFCQGYKQAAERMLRHDQKK